MKKKPPVAKNDEITLTIDALGSEGQGIGRLDGFTVFVPFALPGETVRAHIIKVASSFAVAKLVQIEAESENRAQPRCPIYHQCGGCTMQHLAYPAQLAAKQRQVADALQRLGGFPEAAALVRPTLGMAEPWRYRNKGSFPVGYGADGALAAGFFAPRSHRIVPLEDCPIQQEAVMEVLRAARDWARAYQIPAYEEETQTGVLRHIMARAAGGGVMAVIVTTGELPHPEELIRRLTRQKSVCSIIHNINRSGSNVILGEEYCTIWGEERLPVGLMGMELDVSAASFLQVNPTQTEALYRTAMELLNLSGDETVADVYCGIGAITLLLAKRAKRVIGIENVPQAIEDAKRNAEKNGVKNAEFLCEDAELALPRLVEQGLRPDAVVIDPPRKGCERPALDAILASGVKKLLYVSCNPATLARDCRILADGGFALSAVQPVDLFPHSGHVETVCLLSRLSSD